ncbi:hypothetical protein [uncultured Leifsonia sp.]|uniref:hypothetical protein n=1 Tax=uncultured Leifsonia sp. TaxID=340359 RepID=UPI0025CBFBBA|nr:hypothetical protein [uncultured Leifsonia sp.]
MPRTRRLGLAVAAVPLVAALSGCSVVAAFTPHVEPAIYDTVKDYKAASHPTVAAPSFMPDDATVIRIDYDTQTGEAIMTYASAKQLAPKVCTKVTTAPKPTIQDSWWPTTGIPEKVSLCPGNWSVFAIGSQLYAARPATRK